MNIVLLVIDSLRASSLAAPSEVGPKTPFLHQLGAETTHFRRAYATECWTLPSHCSMFTGLLPSEHGAHFHTMAYARPAPTVAEALAAAGYHTEVVTRNFIFDGTIPGITRGFGVHTGLLSEAGALNPFALLLAAAKPRFRRHIRATGFFHPLQRESRRFLSTFARAMMPADRRSLDYTLDQMDRLRHRAIPYFLFCNLYDVHAPYPPTPKSILRSFRSLQGSMENLMFPYFMSALGAHRYLRADFHLSESGRRMLLGRYHAAIELMDTKLRDFYTAARRARLLDDTLLIVTSDHGEAFGEHGLYLHDASVYDTHLHVPLWIHHPERAATVVDDLVSTRDLFGLMRAVGLGQGLKRTILDATYRAEHPIATAEHFHYPHASEILPRYKQNIVATVGPIRKAILRGQALEQYDLMSDPAETAPTDGTIADLEAAYRRDGLPAAAISAATEHLRRWQSAP